MDIYGILLFIFGIFMGSFFTKVGIRLPENKSIFSKSKCTFCNHEFSFVEKIPIISYIINGGKCKNCNSKISMLNPIIELVTGLLFFLTYKSFIDVSNADIAIIFGIVLIS